MARLQQAVHPVSSPRDKVHCVAQCALASHVICARRFYLLTEKRALRLPTPPQMRNNGNFVVSLRRARAR